MPDGPSITRWLVQLRGGNAEAAEVLFRAYFDRLVRLARAHLSRSAGPPTRKTPPSAR